MANNLPIKNLDLRSLSAGNAVEVYMSFPSDPALVESGDDRPIGLRVLRKKVSDGAISGIDDAGATVLHDAIPAIFYDDQPTAVGARITDFDGYATFLIRDFGPGLVNDAEYAYAAWTMDTEAYDSGTTVASSMVSATVTPSFRFVFDETDWEQLILERLNDGLTTLIEIGQLKTTKNRKPPVVQAMFVAENLALPFVITHTASDSWQESFVGEDTGHGEAVETDAGTVFRNKTGRRNRISIQLQAWSQNKRERDRLAVAIKYILYINLPVFRLAGGSGFHFTSREAEDLVEKTNALIYFQIIDFEIEAPFNVVETTEGQIKEVDVVIDQFEENPLC